MIQSISKAKLQEVGGNSGFYIPMISTPEMKVKDYAFPIVLVFYKDYITIRVAVDSAEVLTSIVLSGDEQTDEYETAEDYVEETNIYRRAISAVTLTGQKGEPYFVILSGAVNRSIPFENYDDAVSVKASIQGWLGKG
jgi:hypothetical protein